MLVDLAVGRLPLEEFLSEAVGTDLVQWRDSRGRSLLFFAAAANEQSVRHGNSMYLLDRGIDVSVSMKKGTTCLHYFMSKQRPKMVDSIEPDIKLFKRMLKAGADINAVSPRSGSLLQSFCFDVMSATPSEEMIRPYYDVFFSAPELDLTGPSGLNRSNLDTIREFLAVGEYPLLHEYTSRFLGEQGIAFP